MAYATGVATSVSDLADKIITFATANGWTLVAQGLRPNGINPEIERISILSKGGNYWGLVDSLAPNANKYLSMAMGTGSGGSPQELTGGSTYAQTNFVTEPFVEHHFFYDDTLNDGELFVVVEHQAGRYRHLGFGDITKFGTWDGGKFFTNTSWSQNGTAINNEAHGQHQWPFRAGATTGNGNRSAIRADLTGSPEYKYFGNNVVSASFATSSWAGFLWGANNSASPSRDAVNSFNGLTILHPIYIFGHNGTADYFTLGVVETCRQVWLNNLNPKDIITLGADDWMVFPLAARNGATGQENSGLRGFAYKKVS